SSSALTDDLLPHQTLPASTPSLHYFFGSFLGNAKRNKRILLCRKAAIAPQQDYFFTFSIVVNR
ncbi:MAG: hypothetical protein E6X17_12515, partial [Sporomusaceae bacterium]|nr:hypothetical protein [Sporomusaceae bacterium]